MLFSHRKCEIICTIKRKSPIMSTYSIHGQGLDFVRSGKYLGVNISDNLSWNAHVAETTKRANNFLAFFRRNLASCPQEINAQTYKSLARPIVEYANTLWDHHTETNINQVERSRDGLPGLLWATTEERVVQSTLSKILDGVRCNNVAPTPNSSWYVA